MTIRRRLIWTLLVLIGFLGMVGYLGLRTASSVREDFELVSDETLPVLQALEELRFGVIRAISSSAEYAFINQQAEEGKEEEEEVLLIAQGKALGMASLARYLDLVDRFFPDEKEIADGLQNSTEAVFRCIDEFVELVRVGTEGSELLEKKEELEALEQAFLLDFNLLLDHERNELAERREAVSNTIAAGQMSVGVVAAAGLLIAGTFALGFVLVFSSALKKLTDGAKRFGAGELEWRIDLESADELTALARGLEKMAGDLRRSTVSSSFLKGLLQSMLDGLIVVGPDGNMRMVNQGLIELLGRSEADLVGRPFKDLFVDPRFSSASQLDSLLQAGLIGQQTSTFAGKEGTEIPVSLSSSLLLSGDTIDGVVCVAQDLRGRLQLQEEVLRQRDLLAGTLASIGDAVIATDTSAKVTFINRVAEEMTGWSQTEAEGRNIEDVFQISNEYTGAIAQNPVHRVLAEGITVGLANHTVLTARHGGRLPIDDSAAPIRDKGGELRGVILVFRDVSTRRKMEHDLLAAKLAADRANQSKSEFLAMMSHEIRTPLNGIVGVSRLLLDTASLAPLEKGYAETIHLSGNTLMALIGEILDFSRIEQGAVVLDQKAFNLLQCIEEAFDIVAPSLLDKDLELHYQVDPDLPSVLVGDVNRLKQVLINLINNAIKFTPAGEVSLWVTQHLGEGPKTAWPGSEERLLFAIKDTGIGIPPGAADRIFEPFAQLDSSRMRKYAGSGLGLTISKRLVELMGGNIWLENGSSGGSTFFFTIAVPTPLRLPGSGRPAPKALAGKRALIVSGNATQLSILSSLCVSWNMLPSLTSKGGEALTILKHQPIDIVIIDFDSEEMGGQPLYTAGHRLAPIIALLKPSEADRATALEGLVSECIFKPIRQSALLGAVTRAVEGRTVPEKLPARMADPILAARLPLRILVADDDFINRKVAGVILRSLGYEADVVDDGRTAVAAVQGGQYDVLFMDLRMPEMDGLEATRQIIESLGEQRRPKIIAMTASALEEDRERCLAAGMDDYISKPVLPGVVREKLLQWCAGNGSAVRSGQNEKATLSTTGRLDLEALAELRTVGVFHAVARLFLDQKPDALKEAREALVCNDRQRLADLIHSFSGAAGVVGAFNLSELSKRLERLARGKAEIEVCTSALEEIEREFRSVKKALAVALAETESEDPDSA